MIPNPNLRPFISFYGGKWRIAPYYPAPKYNRIIESFAGSAGYAVTYAQCEVTLVEIDPVIAGLWGYLIHVSEKEILALPIDVIEDVRSLNVCQEAKSLIGFWINKGSNAPKNIPTLWAANFGKENSVWGVTIRQRIANQLEYIRHWKVLNASFDSVDNECATWFIDPPYNNRVGRHYKHKFFEYDRLSAWCKERKGQVIVCENEGADWLPFISFRDTKNQIGTQSKEVIWTQG